jgi:hypothetical protein
VSGFQKFWVQRFKDLLIRFIGLIGFIGWLKPNQLNESTTTRKAGGLDLTAIGGKRQGREAPQSLKTTWWNRGFSREAPGLENPIKPIEPI